MHHRPGIPGLSTLLIAALASAARAQAPAASPSSPWDTVAAILQTPAVPSAGYTRFNLPRRDLSVRLNGATLAIPMATGAWAGFAGTAKNAEAMGDLVLTARELKPVLAELSKQHVQVTAIHNHLVGEEPRIVYVHFHAAGTPADIATRLDSALALTGTPRPVTAAQAPPVTIDTALIFRGLGQSGHAAGAVAQLGLDLVNHRVRWMGHTMVPALAYATPINIQMVNPGRAVATGDFAVLGPKVQPVLDAFAAGGITAEALHVHMVGESPTVYFIHFWADGTLANVVRELRSALDAAKAKS